MNDSKEKPPLPEPSPVEFGGRVELRISNEGAEKSPTTVGTTYSARWFTKTETFEGSVQVALPGPDITVVGPPNLPEFLRAFTVTLLRTTTRGITRVEDFPRRLTRWRKAPDESSSQ